MGNELTRSEQLFEEFCRLNHTGFNRLPECDTKQPDYEILFGDQKVVFEIKQIEANDSDVKFHADFKVRSRNPDHVADRVRNAIDSASKQIRSYLEANGNTPAIVVIFDDANNGHTDPYIIQTAMHGWEEATFSVPADVNRSPTFVDIGFGQRNNKLIRSDRKTHISAVATLHEYEEIAPPHERKLSLCFYHNQHASNSFDYHLWNSKQIWHRVLSKKVSGKPQNWIEPMRKDLDCE